MSDRLTPQQRSANMSRIRGKNTAPERMLRTALHRLGVRYRIHARNVPGRPDLAHGSTRVAVFVDGCFWHGCPRHYKAPASRADFWQSKLHSNVARRNVVKGQLVADGWLVIEAWECEIEAAPGLHAESIREAIASRCETRKNPEMPSY